jgi:hypothetical protein
MDSERSIIDGGASAATCTCWDNLARNGGFVHNYSCQMTPKCQHMVSKIDPRTGGTIQTACGSRLDRHICHLFGCPCLPLCPHCGTSMDRRGVHSIGCPNRPNYSFEYPGNSRRIVQFPDGFEYLGYDHEQSDRPNFQNLAQRLLNFMRVMPVIPPRNPVSPPLIIDGDFEIKGECSVCLLECEQLQRVLKPSGCDHCFHEICLTPWIREHSTCPNCRGETQTILRKN